MNIRKEKWMKCIIISVLIGITGVLYSFEYESNKEWSNLDMVEETEITKCQTEVEQEEHSQGLEDASLQSNHGEDATMITSDEAIESEIFVHVCGEVVTPGVYRLNAGARVYEAIEAAGGMTQEGVQEGLNMASVLTDGMQVIVYSKEEVASCQGNDTYNQEFSNESHSQDEKININTASLEQLKQLSGIGDAKAQAIIDYRNEHGPFETISDIMKISGIKEAAFNKIKDFIQV